MTKLSDTRLTALRAVLDADKLADLRGSVGDHELVEMLLCEIGRAGALVRGDPYYNYASQCWITD